VAIKGKGKTRAKAPARAPRRAPVPVKPPFAQRTWVKATAAFIAGVFLVSMCWWVWENLDKDRNTKQAASDQTQKQGAFTAWKTELETSLASLAQVQGAAVPQIATTIQPALKALGDGSDPAVTAADMDALEGQLDTAATKLEKFDLSGTIAGHGFSTVDSEVITAAQTEIIAALRAYQVAAQLTSVALSTPGNNDTIVAAAGQSLQTGQRLLASGWTKYANVATSVGLQLSLQQGLAPSSGS
jgi:hypothetical protein